MLHNEKHQDYVIEVNPKKLYKKVKRDKIAFHAWYPWVEKEILDIAKEQRPDLYGIKKKEKVGFMQKIKNMFNNKKEEGKGDESFNQSFSRNEELDIEIDRQIQKTKEKIQQSKRQGESLMLGTNQNAE